MRTLFLSEIAVLSLLLPACFSPSTPSMQGGTDAMDPVGSSADRGSSADGNGSSPEDDGAEESGSTSGGASEGGDSDVDPTADSGSTGDGGDDGSTGEGGSEESGDVLQCGAGTSCVSSVPLGWEGPVLFTDGECPEALPLEVSLSHTELSADSPTCSCDCGEPFGTNCGAAVLRARDPNNCVDEDFVTPVVNFFPGGCSNVTSHGADSWAYDHSNFPLAAVGGGACNEIEDHDIPPATWANDFRTCALVELPDACEDGGTCQPDVGLPMCIQREGDHECPPGAFSERTVVFDGIDDSRGCSDCTCGPPTGTCNGTITFRNGGCLATDTLVGTMQADECSPISGATHGQYTLEPDADCTAAGGFPQGSAVEADPRTICCTA